MPLTRTAAESLLTVSDGVVGTRGVLEEMRSSAAVRVNGIYDDSAPLPSPNLLAGPTWTSVRVNVTESRPGRRVLDLRTGVLRRDAARADARGPPPRRTAGRLPGGSGRGASGLRCRGGAGDGRRDRVRRTTGRAAHRLGAAMGRLPGGHLSLIHISETTRLGMISYA